jgi:hypothetical protein
MAKSIYDGGKRRRHFTLSDQGYAHLTAIAKASGISRSEARGASRSLHGH